MIVRYKVEYDLISGYWFEWTYNKDGNQISYKNSGVIGGRGYLMSLVIS